MFSSLNRILFSDRWSFLVYMTTYTIHNNTIAIHNDGYLCTMLNKIPLISHNSRKSICIYFYRFKIRLNLNLTKKKLRNAYNSTPIVDPKSINLQSKQLIRNIVSEMISLFCHFSKTSHDILFIEAHHHHIATHSPSNTFGSRFPRYSYFFLFSMKFYYPFTICICMMQWQPTIKKM